MNIRAVIKYENGWWIGWLIDVPGVNAQERTKEELLESLKIGFEDMVNSKIEIPDDAELVPISIN